VTRDAVRSRRGQACAARLRGQATDSSYLAIALTANGFEHIDAATDPPDHPDYRLSRLDNMNTKRDGALLRGVFITSWTQLQQNDCTYRLRACPVSPDSSAE